MKLTLGFSSCPNDTFMFDAMVHSKSNIHNHDYISLISDVEELNIKAMNSELDISKMSFHAYAYVADEYEILHSGSALGNENGPLLISKRKIYPDEVKDLKIAIPGKYTTANLLMQIAYPNNKIKEYLFSEIEDVVLSDECDAGLIIHETRFTYPEKGLKLITDLGEWWESETDLPIPLGCIVVKRTLPDYIKTEINKNLYESIRYAFNNLSDVLPFVKQHAVNMDENVMMQHINLYVNQYSLKLDEKGENAINTLYNKAMAAKLIPFISKNIFISK